MKLRKGPPQKNPGAAARYGCASAYGSYMCGWVQTNLLRKGLFAMPPFDPSKCIATDFRPAEGRQQALIDAQREHQERELQKFFDKLVEVQSRLFDRSATYNNITITLGYAGFLGIWSVHHDSLHPRDSQIIIGSIGASLLLFLLWTVASSFFTSTQNIQVSKIIMRPDRTPAQKMAELSLYEKKMARRQLVYFTSWYWMFLLPLLTGFAAGIALLLLIWADIVGLGFSLSGLFE